MTEYLPLLRMLSFALLVGLLAAVLLPALYAAICGVAVLWLLLGFAG